MSPRDHQSFQHPACGFLCSVRKLAEGRPDHQAAHDAPRKLGMHLAGDRQRRPCVRRNVAERRHQGVLAQHAACRGDIEDVARLERGAAEDDLLPDDLGGGFELDGMATDVHCARRIVRDQTAANEVDLAETVVNDLQGTASVRLIAVGGDCEIVALYFPGSGTAGIVHR